MMASADQAGQVTPGGWKSRSNNPACCWAKRGPRHRLLFGLSAIRTQLSSAPHGTLEAIKALWPGRSIIAHLLFIIRNLQLPPPTKPADGVYRRPDRT
ncbi:hypothetical protein PGT21_004016 [Puccinia graminis f. sp. tritici]|uniref:Uncharacterized protein n=1 Tax=Puccinia graminis f. sp. tritici TaxID=56615 RepID=A0A5B0QZM6_PUCGR|nr:hypothetical protein PGT21_004016 [Puccinia graminis f. sp. tritici]